ncbi:MAG: ArsC/Spx/MgsR family protein, partial [Candidatus Thermoplasmatota archaeon]|nr:ArsC/Spx/MgsR family protein [Candidatus Thermoplasmatota archaeon]
MRLYHNPRCSKSRQAVALLEEKGVEFETYLYLKQGVASEDMSMLINLEGIVRANDLEQKANLGNREIVKKLLEENPKLLQRPILIANGNAVIGRPPEEILRL